MILERTFHTRNDRRIASAIALLVLIAALVPVLNLWVPADSSFHVPSYMVALVGKYLCYALLALSLDLVWGYCGILSLGHGAFFALGGYAMGMYLMRQIGSRGVYGNPELPDFMVFLNWKNLPWYWLGFDHFLFAASALALSLGVFVTWRLVRSKYGKLMIAVRDAESRTRFLGWRAENVKLFAFTISAVMAGIAGALYVPQVGIINPGEFEPANSIEVVIWTAVGGRGTIVGPILGALLVNAGKSWFTGALPELWLFALGGLFVAVTLFLPQGVLGMWDRIWAARQARRAALGRPPDGDEAAEPAIIRVPTKHGEAWMKPNRGAEPQPAE